MSRGRCNTIITDDVMEHPTQLADVGIQSQATSTARRAFIEEHGGGKVPSMPLDAPDRRSKYILAKETWTNYRTLLERINPSDVEQSKLLRKPLNIQTGQEDGHQGSMRYKPGERGYEILRRWAFDAARLKATEPR